MNNEEKTTDFLFVGDEERKIRKALNKNSSSIAFISYDKIYCLLEVTFTNGSVYEYKGVPQDLVEEIINSDKPGQVFSAMIKAGSWVYEKKEMNFVQGKFYKLIVHKKYNKILDVNGYKNPEKALYNEHIDIVITEPFLVLDIKQFKTKYTSLRTSPTDETWVKVMSFVDNNTRICWVSEIELTMWTDDGIASVIQL